MFPSEDNSTEFKNESSTSFKDSSVIKISDESEEINLTTDECVKTILNLI